MNNNTCVCCGEPIPEGRQVCPKCEKEGERTDEYIRLDTTIIGIDGLINKASTAEEAKVLFTAKDVIYRQQRYAIDVQPVKHGRWLGHHAIWIDQPKIEGWFVQAKCSECEKWAHVMNPYTKSVDYECCPHCGARMDGEQNDT